MWPVYKQYSREPGRSATFYFGGFDCSQRYPSVYNLPIHAKYFSANLNKSLTCRRNFHKQFWLKIKIWFKILMEFVPKCSICNKLALVQIMAWCWTDSFHVFVLFLCCAIYVLHCSYDAPLVYHTSLQVNVIVLHTTLNRAYLISDTYVTKDVQICSYVLNFQMVLPQMIYKRRVFDPIILSEVFTMFTHSTPVDSLFYRRPTSSFQQWHKQWAHFLLHVCTDLSELCNHWFR